MPVHLLITNDIKRKSSSHITSKFIGASMSEPHTSYSGFNAGSLTVAQANGGLNNYVKTTGAELIVVL